MLEGSSAKDMDVLVDNRSTVSQKSVPVAKKANGSMGRITKRGDLEVALDYMISRGPFQLLTGLLTSSEGKKKLDCDSHPLLHILCGLALPPSSQSYLHDVLVSKTDLDPHAYTAHYHLIESKT